LKLSRKARVRVGRRVKRSKGGVAEVGVGLETVVGGKGLLEEVVGLVAVEGEKLKEVKKMHKRVKLMLQNSRANQ